MSSEIQGDACPSGHVGSNPLSRILAQQPVVILDGAMGTELEARGIDLSGSMLWSAQLLLDNPSVLRDIHLAYLESGADVITTATYQVRQLRTIRTTDRWNMMIKEWEFGRQCTEVRTSTSNSSQGLVDDVGGAILDQQKASMEGFKSAGLDRQQAHDKICLAVQLADEAIQQYMASQEQQPPLDSTTTSALSQPIHQRSRPLLGFSAGSYGAVSCDGQEFKGDYAETMTEQQLADWHLQRLEPVLQNPQVNMFCFETVPCLAEVRGICRLLSTHPQLSNAHAWLSCSCRDGQSTCHGESFAGAVVPELWACDQIVGIGINCTHPAHVTQLIKDAKAAMEQLQVQDLQSHGEARKPRQGPPPVLLVYPNSGEQWDGEGRCWVEHSSCMAGPYAFSDAARDWVAAGARAVGGCCRTGPKHIAALRRAFVG